MGVTFLTDLILAKLTGKWGWFMVFSARQWSTERGRLEIDVGRDPCQQCSNSCTIKDSVLPPPGRKRFITAF